MKKALLALAAVLALVLTASALGDDFSQGNGAKAAANWKVLGLGPSGQTSTSKPATAFADGIGFAFSTTPTDTRLFVTPHAIARRADRCRLRTCDHDPRLPGCHHAGAQEEIA